MFYTAKYNNGGLHKLDDFDNQADAITSAQTLHNPDWPCWQGIFVKELPSHKTIFDTNR